jgi:hypothetical protein
MSDLKPCPFCGDAGWMHSKAVFQGAYGHKIECQGACHAATCYWHTKEEAESAWNQRIESAQEHTK